MKFKEYLQEDLQEAKIQSWLQDWHFSSFRFSDEASLNSTKNLDEIVDSKSLRVVAGLESIDLYTQKSVTFSWPFAKPYPHGMELSIQGSDTKVATIDGLKGLPDTQTLLLIRSVKVTSLEGFENSKVLVLGLDHLQEDIECGLLRLLKSKHLQVIKPPKTSRLPELNKAISIIEKYLTGGDGDIADCMDELIEAGLKKYAKL